LPDSVKRHFRNRFLPGQKNDSELERTWQGADAEKVLRTYEVEHDRGEERITSWEI